MDGGGRVGRGVRWNALKSRWREGGRAERARPERDLQLLQL